MYACMHVYMPRPRPPKNPHRTWLKVLADPAASIVPTETAARGPQYTGPPAARKPAEVVSTTSALCVVYACRVVWGV